MPSYQIQKHEVIGRYNKWTQAFGLKDRSFLRADGETPVNREAAIEKFKLDTKRCKKNLILVEYPDFGLGGIILAEVNPLHDVSKVATEIVSGEHSKLFKLLQDRQMFTDFEQGSDAERIERIALGLTQAIYPNEREELLEAA